MSAISEELLDRFVAACRDMAGWGLVRCSCGNLSMRVDFDAGQYIRRRRGTP